MEGPFFNPNQCGAQDISYMQTPSVDKMKKLKQAFPKILRISVAPELENGYEVGIEGKKLNVVMSAGHTDADFGQIEKAIQSGYTLLTHFYSGMKGVTRKNSFRIAGAVEAGYYFDDLFVEIIADGRHLPNELLKLIYKIKGADKIALITDATRAAGLSNGENSILGSRKNGIPIIVEDDVAKMLDRQSFAGSSATFDRVFKQMSSVVGDNPVDLMKMSALTPAKIMGLNDRGEIAKGKIADFVLMDKNYNVISVIKEGEKL